MHAGDMVIAISYALHKFTPRTYPKVGTKGLIIQKDDNDILVEWERGTVTKSDWVEERGKYSWWCKVSDVRLVNES